MTQNRPMISGTRSSVAPMIPLGREPAEAVPQRPFRRPLGLIEPTLTAWRKARLDRRPTGQPAKVDLRDVFKALLYINRTGIPWKYLPHDFPNYGTVYASWRDEKPYLNRT